MEIKTLFILPVFFLSHIAISETYLEAGLSRTENSSHFSASNGIKLNLGYSFNDYVSIEGSYAYLGEGQDNKPPKWSIDTYVFSSDIKLQSPKYKNINAYTKFGINYWGLEVTENNFGTVVKDSGLGALLGVGIDYAISDKLTIGADYSQLNINNENTDVFTFKLGYKFKGKSAREK